MTVRSLFVLIPAGAFLLVAFGSLPAPACCPAPRFNQPVVNADQTVILIWDAATKTQHFIRQASFKSAADDFGFIVPSPSQPTLDESGNDAFPYLAKLTAPEVERRVWLPNFSCGCGATMPSSERLAAPPEVRVLQEKLVAGFNAVVLEADTADVLVTWLKQNGYAYSPEVAAWAKPYVDQGWKFTALKVAKGKDEKDQKTVAAGALRISFHTERPLFPYREPDPKKSAAELGATQRLLRIYFIAEARYKGEVKGELWSKKKVAWANRLKAADRQKILELLKLPENTGPAEWWLTEFEDNWPYEAAPADVYFSRDADQSTVKRPTNFEYVAAPAPRDLTVYAVAAALVLPPLARRLRRRRSADPQPGVES